MSTPVVLLSGLPGTGKSTLARALMMHYFTTDMDCELIDGDAYRAGLCADLGFSRADRIENNRRIGFVASRFSSHAIPVIIAAICPYEEGRNAIREQCAALHVVHVTCPTEVLFERDPKGHYRRATLPPEHKDHIAHFTGISDPYEAPRFPDLILDTYTDSPSQCLLIVRALLEET